MLQTYTHKSKTVAAAKLIYNGLDYYSNVSPSLFCYNKGSMKSQGG